MGDKLPKKEKFSADELLVRIDKQLLDEESIFHLSVEELYLYFLLNANERRNNTVEINLNTLQQKTIFKSGSKKFDNVKIAEILNDMERKKIITANRVIDSNNETQLFEIKFNHSYLENVSIKAKNKWEGFIQIPYSLLNKITRIEHLYIYSVIFMYNDKYNKGFVCPYNRWSKILGKSIRTVKRHIQELVELKIIHVNIGDYVENSRTKQKVNTYQIKKFKEKEKTKATKAKEKTKLKKELKEKIVFDDGENHKSDKDFETPF